MDDTLREQVRAYTAEHGFGEPALPLTRSLSADDFDAHYYDKKALMAFCRLEGLSVDGLKPELTHRISTYLRTGERYAPKPKRAQGVPDSQRGSLSLSQRVVQYKSDPATRAFFHSHIEGFTGFSAHVQKWLKMRLNQGEVFTYAEVIAEHRRVMEAKQTRAVLPVAHKSCEYNQFAKDAGLDKLTIPHTIKEAWALVRDAKGPKTYAHYKAQLTKVIAMLGLK